MASLTAVSQLKAAESLLAVQNRKAVSQTGSQSPPRFPPRTHNTSVSKVRTLPLFVLNVRLQFLFFVIVSCCFFKCFSLPEAFVNQIQEQFSCNAAGICCRVASQAYKPKLEGNPDSNFLHFFALSGSLS